MSQTLTTIEQDMDALDALLAELGGDLSAEEVRAEILVDGDPTCSCARLDHPTREDIRSNAIRVDGVGADAVLGEIVHTRFGDPCR